MIYLNNEGNNNNQILHDENNNEKEYLVTLKEPMGKNFIHKMSNGVPILDTITKKCYVEKINDHQFKIILTQGLNRQIRRMTEYLGNKVVKLKRYRIMNIKIGRAHV